MNWEEITGAFSGTAVLFDVLMNGAELLLVLSDTLLTPVMLFAFTILPNVGTPESMAWVQDVFIALVVLFGVVALLNALDNALDRFRSGNES